MSHRHPVERKYFKMMEFYGLTMRSLRIGPFWVDEKTSQFSNLFCSDEHTQSSGLMLRSSGVICSETNFTWYWTYNTPSTFWHCAMVEKVCRNNRNNRNWLIMHENLKNKKSWSNLAENWYELAYWWNITFAIILLSFWTRIH